MYRTPIKGSFAGLSLLALSAVGGIASAAPPGYTVEVTDAGSGRALHHVTGSGEVSLSPEDRVELRVTPDATSRIDRVYVLALSGSDPECRLDGGKVARLDAEFPFEFEVGQADGCRFKIRAYDDTAHEAAASTVSMLRPTGDRIDTTIRRRFDVTKGTSGATSMQVGPVVGRGGHGVRVYCPVSHFSYDDPIVFPGQPDKAHFHMFLGNTSTNAYSTATSLKNANSSSCEGGTNMESAYWMPAVFNDRDEVVLPEHFIAYYKTFMIGRTPDQLPAGTIKPIPNGLEMLASPVTKNWDQRAPKSNVTEQQGKLKLEIHFPQCVATHPDGRPVLNHRDMPGDAAEQLNSHLAYQNWGTGNANTCPSSHPYRIPGVTYISVFDIDPDSRWYLASDKDRTRPGHSLHADYMAAWNQADMDRVVRCNEEGRSCEFTGNRGQLPERFYDWDGNRVYNWSTGLVAGKDRTPWGQTIPTMQHLAGHH